MKGYLLVRDSDGVIASFSKSVMSEQGCTLVDLDEVVIGGDELPTDACCMTGGKLIDLSYTKPAAPDVDPLITALKALDSSVETGALKTVIEYLQKFR